MKNRFLFNLILILSLGFISCFSLPDKNEYFEKWFENDEEVELLTKEQILALIFGTDDDSEDYDKSEQSAFEKSMNDTTASLEKALEEITPEMEYYIGRAVAANITKKYSILDAPELTGYLNKICSAITVNSPKPYLYKGYCVAILDTEEINAMATPGGHIFVTKGLLRCTDSEDAIASILAHEISHIQLGHSIKAIKASRVTDTVLKSLITVGTYYAEEEGIGLKQEDVESFGKTTDAIFGTLVDTGFSVLQEFKADTNALVLLADTGYEPEAMIDMLELLKSDKNTTDESSGWGKTHPKPETRIANVKRVLKELDSNGKKKSTRKSRFKKYIELFDA